MVLKIMERMRSIDESVDVAAFKASTGWLEHFKKRHNLGSRRHTTDRRIPENASQLCKSFIQEFQELIDSHKILARNIVNMDQVPWYFETEPNSTICTRGSQTVLLRKGGTSHKRFTIFSLSLERVSI